jgi:hypothetical protein
MDESGAVSWGRALGAAVAGLFASWLVAGLLGFVALLIGGAALSGVQLEGDDGLGVALLVLLVGLVAFGLIYVAAAGVIVPMMARRMASRDLSFGAGVATALASIIGPVLLTVASGVAASELLAAVVGLSGLALTFALPAWVVRRLARPADA